MYSEHLLSSPTPTTLMLACWVGQSAGQSWEQIIEMSAPVSVSPKNFLSWILIWHRGRILEIFSAKKVPAVPVLPRHES